VRWLPLLFACLVVAADGQETVRPPSVRIGAVVTDRSGRPLLDLTASDFDLRSGGVAQAIEAVELHRGSADPAAGRAFAIFLDEFHVAAGVSSARVRAAVQRFLDEHVRPSDRVALMKPLDSQLTIELANDPGAWKAAIETFEGRAGDFAPRSGFEEQYLGRAPELVQASRAQIVTSALRALVTRLGEASTGRSAIAFVSEGFPAPARVDRERRMPDFTAIARLASRSGVAIYALNPAASPGGDPNGRAEIEERLRRLAADTGGEAAAGDQLSAALGRVSRDLDSYYLVAFRPSPRGEGRFYELELTARRRGAIVRAPAGYWTPVTRAAPRAAAAPRPLRVLRRSPIIQSWYGVTRLADGRMRLRVTWEPPRTPPPAARQPHAVQLRAAGAEGGALLFEGTIVASALAEAIVPAGRVELDLTIVSADGAVLDREARDVEVPNPDAPRVVSLPPEIIRARTLREFQAASVNPAATPTAVREFRRSDRLIVRAPAISSDASPVRATARLLNRWGQPMRDLDAIDANGSGILQFSLPLSWLVPGEYEIELRTRGAGTEISQKIPVRVIG
jgi:VWFA-related protein